MIQSSINKFYANVVQVWLTRYHMHKGPKLTKLSIYWILYNQSYQG